MERWVHVGKHPTDREARTVVPRRRANSCSRRAAEKANRCYVQDAKWGREPMPITSEGTIGFLVSADATKLLTHDLGGSTDVGMDQMRIFG